MNVYSLMRIDKSPYSHNQLTVSIRSIPQSTRLSVLEVMEHALLLDWSSDISINTSFDLIITEVNGKV